MRKTICILSDSHAAALKQGLRRVAPGFPDVEVTFFVGTRSEWENVSVDRGAIVAPVGSLREKWLRSSPGKHAIGDEYDVYVVYGIGISTWGTLMQKMILQQVPYDSEEMARVIYSSLSTTPGLKVVSALRKITRHSILMIAAPHSPSEFSIPLRTLTPEALRHLVAQFHKTCVRLAEEFGAKFIAQPGWTVNPDGATTNMKFFSGMAGDKGHMNADYGAIIAGRVLRSSSLVGLKPL